MGPKSCFSIDQIKFYLPIQSALLGAWEGVGTKVRCRDLLFCLPYVWGGVCRVRVRVRVMVRVRMRIM